LQNGFIHLSMQALGLVWSEESNNICTDVPAAWNMPDCKLSLHWTRRAVLCVITPCWIIICLATSQNMVTGCSMVKKLPISMASHPRGLWVVAQKSVWFGLQYVEIKKCSCLHYIPSCISDRLWNPSFLYWQASNVNATWFTVKLCRNVAFCTCWYHFNRWCIWFSTKTQPR